MSVAKPRLAYLFSRHPVVSQTFCDSEMLALERMGFEIEVAALFRPRNSFRHERLDRLKAEIHYVPEPGVVAALADAPEFKTALGGMIDDHLVRYGADYKPVVCARNAWYLAALFRRLGVRHVHVHFANRATHTALFLKKLGFPFSFTAHAQDFMFDLGCDELLREMAREAEFVVAVSDYSRELLCRTCPESAAKITRIYNGAELGDFPAAIAEQRTPLRLVSVGRLVEFKGFEHLIGACGILKRRGVTLDLRIIGDGPLRAQLEERIRAEGVQDCVTLPGVRSQEEIKRELAAADLFALASIVDSTGSSDILPTVITEAMACGLPVVSTTVAGIPEMVEHGVTGLLVAPKDEGAMADAISGLAGDVERRRAMGEAGRARAQRLFSLDVTAGVLGARFIELAGSGRLPERTRAADSVVYLVREWKGAALVGDAPSHQEGVRWLAEEVEWAGKGGDRATLEVIEALPDACVIESIWLRRAEERARVEAARPQTGDAVDSDTFYRCARHAVYLAETLGKRGARVLHAHRSDAVVTAWLLKKLRPGLKVTAAIEEEPVLPRGLLTRLLPDFDLVSNSDARLGELAGEAAAARRVDVLKLALPFVRREIRLGPFHLKTKMAAPVIDRRAAESEWLRMLRELIR